MSNWSDEEIDDPHYADRRNFYKVEKWSRDGKRRQRTRLLDQWPRPPASTPPSAS